MSEIIVQLATEWISLLTNIKICIIAYLNVKNLNGEECCCYVILISKGD